MKTCRRCGYTLDVSEFNFKDRARGRLQVYCKRCSRQYVQDHYWRNKPYYVRKAMARNGVHRRDLFDRLLAYFRSHPCVDCGESDPVVLDFDHVDAASKSWNIADKVADGWAWRTIQAEIAKCVVRCANCHRRRTARQFGWYRYRLTQVSAPVAQRIEQQPSELWVGSSNLSGRANHVGNSSARGRTAEAATAETVSHIAGDRPAGSTVATGASGRAHAGDGWAQPSARGTGASLCHRSEPSGGQPLVCTMLVAREALDYGALIAQGRAHW